MAMRETKGIFVLFMLLAAASLLQSGCALTQERVKLSYAPQVAVPKVERADSSVVTVEVIDSRATKNRVGAKHNAYGMEMAAITSEEDVAVLVKRAIDLELENRGFRHGAGKALVIVELTKFENDFQPGFFSADAEAELFMSAQVKDAKGQILYTKSIEGKGLNSGVQLMGGQNAKIALEAALKDAVSKLFQEPQFLESIVKAGG
jgi:uncharacterized lipoprotein